MLLDMSAAINKNIDGVDEGELRHICHDCTVEPILEGHLIQHKNLV